MPKTKTKGGKGKGTRGRDIQDHSSSDSDAENHSSRKRVPPPQVVVPSKALFPDIYREGTDIFDWLETYESRSLLLHWNEESKLQYAGIYLRGQPASWFRRSVEQGAINEWGVFREQLLKCFSSVAAQPIPDVALCQRALLPGETVQEYFCDILRLCALVDPHMPEPKKVAFIINGLPNNWKFAFAARTDLTIDTLLPLLTQFDY